MDGGVWTGDEVFRCRTRRASLPTRQKPQPQVAAGTSVQHSKQWGVTTLTRKKKGEGRDMKSRFRLAMEWVPVYGRPRPPFWSDE
jgi:hypothetical protein